MNMVLGKVRNIADEESHPSGGVALQRAGRGLQFGLPGEKLFMPQASQRDEQKHYYG
jgi:hypothetical protein